MPETVSAQLTPLTKPLHIRLTSSPVGLPDDLIEKIAAHWDTLTAQNPHLFNGDAFTVTGYIDAAEAIEVEVAETKYAHNLYSEAHDAGKYSFKVIHSACLVVTSDNKFVVGEMGLHTARAGQICCSGGGIDRGDIRGNIIDLDHSTTHELQEELGISPYDEHAVSFRPAYMVSGGPLGKITVAYELRTDLSSAAFKKHYGAFTRQLAATGKDSEFGRILFVDNTLDAIEEFIAAQGDHLDQYIAPLLRATSQQTTTA